MHTKYLFLPIFGPFSRLRTKENCQIEKINSKFVHKLTETIIIRANAVKILPKCDKKAIMESDLWDNIFKKCS